MKPRTLFLTITAVLLAAGTPALLRPAAASIDPIRPLPVAEQSEASQGSTTAGSGPRFCSGVDVEELSRRHAFRYGLTAGELQSEFFDSQTGLSGDGYRPTRLTGYRDGSTQLFATKWVAGDGPTRIGRFDLTGEAFHALYLERRNLYRPIDVSGYNTPSGGVRFAVIWERNLAGVAWKVHRDVSRDGMQQLADQYAQSGWVPLRVEAYTLNGEPHYISIWVHTPCSWGMHNKMTRDQYQAHLDEYSSTHRLVQLDSFVDDGDVYYAGIWWKQPGPGQAVRSNRDWYLFQRFLNNYQCQGAVLNNFYAADLPGAIRYGGIWTSLGAPDVGPNSSLTARIRQEVDCAPGRAGAAVINLTTGESVMVHADGSYGTSSTIKSAILYALLRRIDATPATLDTQLNVDAQYGDNQAGANPAGMLTADQSYTLRFLATTMIQNSNNWAANRLIDWIGLARTDEDGMAQVNQELDNLGLDRIRLRRYMISTQNGAPSTHGNAGSNEDYYDGWDNTATPRQYATFLRRMHQNNGLLAQGSWDFFWTTLALNGGAHDAVLDAGVGSFRPFLNLSEKAGNNPWSSTPDHRPQLDAHVQRSAAGRLEFTDGQVVFYAAFVDEADSPDNGLTRNMLDCVVMQAVRQYSGQTTGNDVPQCRAG